DEFLNYIYNLDKNDNLDEDQLSNEFNEIEIYIFEKFWPRGSNTFHKHRHHNAICGYSKFNLVDLMKTLKNLKKRRILLTPDKEDFYELNLEF
ncbi:hypothetical protein ABTK17_19255, partial [Acinetobacter baumannii]